MNWFWMLLFCWSISGLYGQKTMTATRVQEKITIDGEAKEAAWQKTEKIADFVQYKPSPGSLANQSTEVAILYDDEALYVFAWCKDKPENISKVLSQRDDFNANVDNFQLLIDTYNDDINAFNFGVSSMGVQFDSKLSLSGESVELNMVWSSHVHITEEGYQVEIKIPYSAIRFPKVEVQNWGINFFRYVSKTREESTWNPVKPDFDNWVAQFGDLKGVQGISPPLRLAFIPYISGYADHFKIGSDPRKNWSGSMNGGMDIKWGLNEAFTLDMTLVPDFGQVVFDNQVLNLTPFELQFNENRQFFTEGTELFNKAGLFYSRRVGVQSPYAVKLTQLRDGESLKNYPVTSQLYNATKLSGRTKKGLGIGVFNGVSAQQKGTAINDSTGVERSIIVDPLTNYNVLVLDQNLKNNSYITFTNTNVLREGRFYDANVSGLNTKINTKNNLYYIAGRTALSNKFYPTRTSTGYNYNLSAGKQTGNLVYGASYFEESNTFDPNDLGFNANNNRRIISGSVSYRVFKPFWKLNQMGHTLAMNYNRLYKPNEYVATNLNFSSYFITKRFHAAGFQINSGITESNDFFEARTTGAVFIQPKWMDIGGWISTNYQKRFALDGGFTYTFIGNRPGWTGFSYNISPRTRISNRLFFVYSFEQNNSFNAQGYAVPFGTASVVSSGIVFGQRDQRETTQTIQLSYTITNRMGATFRLRHYRSVLKYDAFYDLQDNGRLLANSMTGLDSTGASVYDINFNAFTIDFVYRWVFLPGSEINVVWKNAIFQSDLNLDQQYFKNLNQLFRGAPLNSLSVKIIYWLDYQSFKKLKRK